MSYATNRYPVPWTLAGQRVLLVERGEELVVVVGTEPVIRHSLCRARHQVIDPGTLHADLPLGPAKGGRRKPSVTIRETLPEVEARPLSVYEALAWDRNDECPAVATEGVGNAGIVARAIGEIGTNGGRE